MGKIDEVLNEITELHRLINSQEFKSYDYAQKYLTFAELNALNAYYNILRLKEDWKLLDGYKQRRWIS